MREYYSTNVIVEQKLSTLGRSSPTVSYKNVHKIYWDNAILTALYLIKSIPSVVNGKSPLDFFIFTSVSFTFLEFGCTYFIQYLGYNAKKYNPKKKKKKKSINQV